MLRFIPGCFSGATRFWLLTQTTSLVVEPVSNRVMEQGPSSNKLGLKLLLLVLIESGIVPTVPVGSQRELV